MQIRKQTSEREIVKKAPPCHCDKCSHGCTVGSGFFAPEQLPKVATFLNIDEETLKKNFLEEVRMWNTSLHRPAFKKPFGTCTFYDKKKGCTIHPVKPLQCKISSGCSEEGEAFNAWFLQNYALNEKDELSKQEFETYKAFGGRVLE